MTQKEFDDQMNALRQAQQREAQPIDEQIKSIIRRKGDIMQQMYSLESELQMLKAQRILLQQQLRMVGAKYWEAKRQLIEANPKATPLSPFAHGRRNRMSRHHH